MQLHCFAKSCLGNNNFSEIRYAKSKLRGRIVKLSRRDEQISAESQYDKIGLLFKGHGNKFSHKNCPYIWQRFGLFSKHHFLSKNYSDHHYGNFGKPWATLFSNIWSHWVRDWLTKTSDKKMTERGKVKKVTHSPSLKIMIQLFRLLRWQKN